jgi:ubiquinone/menaquinone biosynthesis C-methylase UbiE
MTNPVAIQLEYYEATASAYDDDHAIENAFETAVFSAALRYLKPRSLLDIGSGTGRLLLAAKEVNPDMEVLGIEPSDALRQRGYTKGLLPTELVEGDAQDLAFGDESFDVVSELAALHHIPDPTRAVSEMLRVARRAIIIIDANNFGQGRWRLVKQAINSVGLWALANFIKTRGRGYDLSDGDGLSYSYSVFNNLPLIRRHCKEIMLFGKGGPNLYRSSPHCMIIGIKR